MKIEIGMYIRFKKEKINYIRRLLEFIHNYEEFNVYRTASEYFDYEEKDYFNIVYPGEIIGNPSYKIIDLIKEGDYVNGEKVIRIFNPTFLSLQELPYVITINNKYESQEIKSIVTHEQFESMKYEVYSKL